MMFFMTKRLWLVLGFAVVASATVLAQDVRYNFDKQANFASFKTYKWVAIKDAQPLNNIMDGMVKSAIDAELGKKGLTKTTADSADLYIGYQAGVDSEKQYTSYSSGWGYGPGWYGGGWYGTGGMTTTSGSTSTIYVGQLAVDMYSSHDKSLVWRGVMSKTIDPKAKPEKQEKNMAKAVAKLFKNYPPPPEKKK